MKERDLNKTVCGLIFAPYFLLGLVRVLLGAGVIYGIYRLVYSDEPLFLKIAGCVILGISCFGCFYTGFSNIRETWKDWTDYRREE